ncbi:MAG TPA: tetratricopeptide repeat protein, partial [Candidatus Binatia bacterium]|nr:tetratricopeptide repeat protein [Candidatus Binatia bacterium]
LRKIENSLEIEKPGPSTFGGLGINRTVAAIIATLVLGTGTAVWIMTAPHQKKSEVDSTPSPVPKNGQEPGVPRKELTPAPPSPNPSGVAKPQPKPSENPKVKEHLTIGEFYLNRGQYSEAIAEFQQALSLDPSNQEVRERIARAQSAWKAEKELGLAR